MKACVSAAAREKLIMRAMFDDAAVAEHNDLMCMANGGKAVSDDEVGSPFEQFFKGVLN